MHMVVRLPPGVQAEEAYLYGFQITGEHAVWWGYDGDIWRVPLNGGVPEQLLRERYLRVSAWPWAYDDGKRTVVNVETGQEIEVTAADDLENRLACGPAWCVGENWQELWKVTQATVLRVDGSERTTMPGDALPMRPPIRDRLVLLGVPTVYGDDSIPRTPGVWGLGHVTQIYDRCTKQTALLGSYALIKAEMPWQEIKIGAWTKNGPLVFWRTAGDRLMIADLARIGASSCSV